MNLLNFNNGELLPKYNNVKMSVKPNKVYSFGDILNIWESDDNWDNRYFIRDDNYKSNANYYLHVTNNMYDKHIVQTFYYDDGERYYYHDEVFTPTAEDLFGHEWYELNID